MPEIDRAQLIERMADALSEAVDYFVARDEMNAKVHLQEPRWSPITDACRDALEMWRQYAYPALIDGPDGAIRETGASE